MAGIVTKEQLYEKDLFSSLIEQSDKLLLALDKLEEQLKDILKVQAKVIEQNKGRTDHESVNKLSTANKKVSESAKKLTTIEQERSRLMKEQEKLMATQATNTSNVAKENQKLKQSVQESNKATKDLIKLQQAEKGSVDQLNAVNSILRKRRNAVNTSTEEGRKKIARLNAAIDRNNKKIISNSDQLKKNKLQVGGYATGIKDAAAQMGPFGAKINIVSQGFQALKTGLKAAKLGFHGLKGAIAATGVGAIVIAFVALISYFKRFQAGIDGIKKVTAGLSAGFDVLLDRLSTIGEAFKLFFSGDFKGAINAIKESFSGLGDEIAREVQLAMKLQELTIELTREQKLFTAQQAASVTKTKELNILVKDRLLDDQKRLEALGEIEKIENDISGKRVDLAERALAASLESLSADQKKLQLSEEELVFIERIKDGKISAAEATKLATDFTISSAKGEESLFAVIEKVVELEQAKQVLSDQQTQAVKRRSSIVRQIAEKDARAFLQQSQLQKKYAEDQEKTLQEREKALRMAAEFEIESAKARLNGAIINEIELQTIREKVAIDTQKAIDELYAKGAEKASKNYTEAFKDDQNELKETLSQFREKELKELELSLIESGATQEEIEIELQRKRLEQLKEQRQEYTEEEMMARTSEVVDTEMEIAKLQREIKEKEAEEDKKRTKEAVELRKKLIKAGADEFIKAQEKEAQAAIKTAEDKISAIEKSISFQEGRAAEGLNNSLAAEKAARSKAEREKIEAQKRASRVEKIRSFYNVLSNSENVAEGIAEWAIAEAFAAGIKGFEKGGKVKGKEQLIRINEKGEEYVINAPATNKWERYAEGMNEGTFEQMIHNDFVQPAITEMPRFEKPTRTGDFERLEKKFDVLIKVSKETSEVYADSLNNAFGIMQKQGNKKVKTIYKGI